MSQQTGSSQVAVPATGGSGLAVRVRQGARMLIRDAAAAFARTPVEVLLGAAAAVTFSVATQRETMDDWARVIAGVGIALPLTYAASALHERGAVSAAVRWAITAAAVAAGALWGLLLLDTHREADAWRAWLLVGAALAALLCVPLVGPAGDRRERTHRFMARLVSRAAVVLAYAAALWIGLSLALAAVNGLFELHMSGKAYSHLAAAVFMLMPPWAVAAGLPALVAPAERWGESQLTWFRRIGALLLAPLVLVYLGIVYAYAVRVIATGEVPKNLVSPVVIGAGLLIVLTTLALEPTYEDARAAGLAWVIRWAAPLLLPLVIFAAWAVSTRVDQYGWTEFRYTRLLVLLLLGIYAAAALYRRVRRRRPPVTAVPVVVAAALLLAAVGPWSATAVAHRSQTDAMRELLTRVRRPTAATPTAVAVAPRVFRGLTSGAEYLNKHFGWDAVRAVVPSIGAKPTQRVGTGFYATRLGIVERMEAGMTRVVNARLPAERGVPGIAGGTLFTFEVELPRPGRGRDGDRQGAGKGGPAAGSGGRAAAGVADSARKEPGVTVTADSARGLLFVVAPSGDTLVADVRPTMQALLARSAAETGSPIYDRRGGDSESVETGRAISTELSADQVVQPLRRAGGQPAGQLVLRRVDMAAEPAPGVAGAKAGGGAPQSPGGSRLVLRAAGGFVILPPELAAPRR